MEVDEGAGDLKCVFVFLKVEFFPPLCCQPLGNRFIALFLIHRAP